MEEQGETPHIKVSIRVATTRSQTYEELVNFGALLAALTELSHSVIGVDFDVRVDTYDSLE